MFKKTVLIALGVVLFAGAFWFGIRYNERERIAVVSDVKGVEAKFNNLDELERLLFRFRFWEGVERLVIHITDEEYSTVRFVGTDGKYLTSAKAEPAKDGTLHLYLGFRKEHFIDKVGAFNRLIDTILIDSLFDWNKAAGDLTLQGLIDLRNQKKETEPFIVLNKK